LSCAPIDCYCSADSEIAKGDCSSVTVTALRPAKNFFEADYDSGDDVTAAAKVKNRVTTIFSSDNLSPTAESFTAGFVNPTCLGYCNTKSYRETIVVVQGKSVQSDTKSDVHLPV
jgi:hypothetical protein